MQEEAWGEATEATSSAELRLLWLWLGRERLCRCISRLLSAAPQIASNQKQGASFPQVALTRKRCASHIDSELPKVLIKVLFWALFWGKELLRALFLVLSKVPELFWALFKALHFALYWNTFLEHFFKH